MRRWSFTSGSPVTQRRGATETADSQSAGSTVHETRVLGKARDKAFDFEIGRRPREAQVGSETRVRARSVLPRRVTSYRSSSLETTRGPVFYRPPPTRPMVHREDLAEVAPPETSVEPPTVAEGGSGGHRARNRGKAASERNREVQRRPAAPEASTIPSLTQEESQREKAPSVRHNGDRGKLSFAELTTEDPGSLYGGNELVADESVNFDYDAILNSKSFKNFGMKLPSAPSLS